MPSAVGCALQGCAVQSALVSCYTSDPIDWISCSTEAGIGSSSGSGSGKSGVTLISAEIDIFT